MKSVEDEIASLSASHDRMRECVDSLRPLLLNSVLAKLFSRQKLTDEEIEAVRALLGLNPGARYYAAVIGNISESRFAAREYSRVAEQLIRARLTSPLLCPRDLTAFIALLPADENGNRQRAEAELAPLMDALNALYGAKVCAIGVSRASAPLADAADACREAERAFREAEMWKRAELISYETLRETDPEYQVDYSDLQKLLNCLRSGDQKGAEELLDALIQKNFSAVQTRGEMIYRQFFHEIFGVLLRLSGHADVLPALETLSEYGESPSFESVTQMLRQSLRYACERTRDEKARGAGDISGAIRDYIGDHFQDPDLSLGRLSEHFGMTETSLSRFFKMKLGVNFSGYLEGLRIGGAQALLQKSELPVKEIARLSGYSNITTFYKAFRRREGVSPTEWLEQTRTRAESVRKLAENLPAGER